MECIEGQVKKTINDLADVQRIISDPSVYFSAKDDGVVTPLGLGVEILTNGRFIVLGPAEDTLFLFERRNAITYEIHVAIVSGPARKQGVKNAVKAVRWMLVNTDCRKLVSHIPHGHENAKAFAYACGMAQEGRLHKAYLKDGVADDLIVFGATRDELLQIHGDE